MQYGNLSIIMFLVNPTDKGQDKDNMFARRMRRVTIYRKHQVTQEEAKQLATEFLQENQLDNQDKYQTQAVWSAVEYL